MPPTPPPSTSTARGLAFDILQRAVRTGQFATELLDQQLADSKLSPADRRLTSELVYGVVRRQGTLEALLRPCLTRGWDKVEADLKIVLQLGCYQLALMSAIPQHAAVHETAELTKQIGRPQWTGFVNGVLRTLSRMVTDTIAAAPSSSAVPLTTPQQYRQLTSPVFADPAADFPRYFSAAFGFPLWLVERWSQRFERDELLRLGFWWNAPPPLCLRVNRLRTTRDTFLARLASAGIAARAGEHPDSVWLDERHGIQSIPGYYEGVFSVQDESAMGAASLLSPQPGQTILDLCAAPGGKTTHLAELMSNEGSITAVDVDDRRARLIFENCFRLGITIVAAAAVSRDVANIPAGPFDAVLVDVPCSNTGVLGKRPEARFRLQPRDLTELPELQRPLLVAALERTKPGGRVVYSTCSIEPEENRLLVDAVLAEHPGWRVEHDRWHIPGRPADGGYQALIVSNAAAP